MYETTVISTEVEPLPIGFTGVSVRVLHRGNEESGQVVLTRMAPGAVIPEHWHSEADETVFVLDGDFVEAGVTYGPGTFFLGKAGKPHGPHTSSDRLHGAHAFLARRPISTSMSSTDPRPISSVCPSPRDIETSWTDRMSKEISKQGDRAGRGRRRCPPPHLLRRRRRGRPLRRVLHREHPEQEHPPGVSQELDHVPPLVRGARNQGPETRQARRRRGLRRAARRRRSRSRRSSSTSRPSGCSSTGSSSARSFRRTRPLGPRAEALVKKGKTPSSPPRRRGSSSTRSTSRPSIGLRDRAIIAAMVYSFARVGAMLAMKVEDYYPQGRRAWLRLHEKGGKQHEMPAHHNLEAYIDAYVKAAGIEADKKGPLFRTAKGEDRNALREPDGTAGRLADDPPAGEAGGHQDARSAATASGRPGSPTTSRTAGRSRRPRRWPTTSRRGRPSSTTGRGTRSRSTRSSGSRSEAPRCAI